MNVPERLARRWRNAERPIGQRVGRIIRVGSKDRGGCEGFRRDGGKCGLSGGEGAGGSAAPDAVVEPRSRGERRRGRRWEGNRVGVVLFSTFQELERFAATFLT